MASGPRTGPGAGAAGRRARAAHRQGRLGALLADPEKYPGVLGAVAALVSVAPGREAIAAALGGARTRWP